MSEPAPRSSSRRPWGVVRPAALVRGQPSPWLTGALPALVAVVSLVLSAYTLITGSRPPAVALSAPDRVRVTQGPDAAWLYVQARLVGTGRTDRVEVVSALRLHVEPLEGRSAADFVWEEQGTWSYDPVNRSLSWVYLADPAPLVVSPSAPQLPIGLFMAPAGWIWHPGTYRVTILAEREVAGDDLSVTFIVTLTPDQVAQLEIARGRLFLTVPATKV